jgi:hypothetical protein
MNPHPTSPDGPWNIDRLAAGFLDYADGSCITDEAAHELAAHLGLPGEVVYALEIAWQDDPGGGFWLFPETDGAGRRVGKTCRYRDGRAGVMPGGRRGLSEPDDWAAGEQPLLLPVGILDTLAATALGLPALGRPGNGDGLDDLADRLRTVPTERRLILFAKGGGESGPTAEESARRAAAELGARLGRPVAWAVPPDGAHDIRAWAVGRLARDADHASWVALGRQFMTCLHRRAAPGAEARGITAAELLARELPRTAWVVVGLLPEGVTILAGKPKTGKSWLALQLALAVAGGSPPFGGGAVTPGEVLYLALEDTERRLRGRLEQMLAGAVPAAARLTLVTHWPPLEAGGRDDLAGWLGARPGARLVVVDTLAMLRRRGAAGYQNDNRIVAGLRELAARFGIALLIVHHVRKLPARDPLDTIAGTVGLTGATDTAWVLARPRGECEAVLHVAGRDVGDQELALAWDERTGLWTVLGPAEEHRLSREQARVIDVLTRAARPLTPKELAPLLEKKEGAAKMLLWRMAEKGLVVSEGGAYTVAGRGGGGSPADGVNRGGEVRRE